MLRRMSGGVLASTVLAGGGAALLRQSRVAPLTQRGVWCVQGVEVHKARYAVTCPARGFATSIATAHLRSSSSSSCVAARAMTTHWRRDVMTTLCMSARTQATAPTQPRRMRVNGRDDYIRPQNTPMQWGGSSSGGSGGSQMDSLTPHVRAHLARVYGLLTAGCCVAGVGSMLMIATPLVKVVPFWLPMLGGFVPLLWLTFAPPANPALKTGLFFAFTLLEGMALAPLVLMTSMKGVLLTSIVLTAAIFGGFSAAAYLSPRASLVSWQGPLFGALIGLVAVSLINMLYPTAIAHSLILYGGLALFSVLVAVDTQAMIERARCGAGDAVQDALQMFLNVVNIFVRIAQIMGDSGR